MHKHRCIECGHEFYNDKEYSRYCSKPCKLKGKQRSKRENAPGLAANQLWVCRHALRKMLSLPCTTPLCKALTVAEWEEVDAILDCPASSIRVPKIAEETDWWRQFCLRDAQEDMDE